MSGTDQLLDSAFAACAAGRLREAERISNEILTREPDNVGALHLLGIVAGLTGRAAVAIERLRQVVALAPDSVEALSDLGHLLREQGQLPEAISTGEVAARLDPNSIAAQNNLGQAYLAANRPAEAAACFERAVALDPELALAHYNLGVARQAESRDTEAIACYRRAVALAPNLVEAHARLGNVLYFNGNRAEALASLRRAASAQLGSLLGLMSYATVLFEEGRADAAEDCLRRAIALDPKNAEAHAFLGNVLNGLGRFNEAIAAFAQAAALEPRRTLAYAGIFTAKTVTTADRPMIEQMLSLLAEGNLTDRDRAILHFALGKAFDDLADYEAAMRHYDDANRIEAGRLRRAGRTLDRAKTAADITGLMATYTPDFFARHAACGSASELPLLIVGMPRSGTTLVEQIVSSHPGVSGGDELTFWEEKATALAATGARGFISAATAHQFADEYLALLRGIDPAAHRVTDKMPQNFLHLGLIHLVFPRARIIHCRRNPIDTSLSIYFTHFSVMRDFAFDPSGIVSYYEQYRGLMAHWRSVLPMDRFLEVDYEELVADRERVTRQMIDFCGLAWDDSCLHHETNDRVVKTASLWQARQPVYKTSVERWRRYEPWLGEFRRLLSDEGREEAQRERVAPSDDNR